MTMRNTLDYYSTEIITLVKRSKMLSKMCLGHKEIQRKVQMNTKLVFEEFFERFWLGFFYSGFLCSGSLHGAM